MDVFKIGDEVLILRKTHPEHGNSRWNRVDTSGYYGVIDRREGNKYKVDIDGVYSGFYDPQDLRLITKGGDMKSTQRKTYKQLKESVTVKKDALWQEACDDGTQEYVLLNADDNKDPRQTQKIYERALVEEDPKNFVEVFAVTPAFMTQAELDQWEDFKLVEKRVAKTGKPTSKPRVAKVAPVKAIRGRKVKKAA